MINFFRKISQNLLFKGTGGNPASAKSSAGRYLKYAIGEIILVMVGILLALQVNNWNEERKAAKKEIEILTALYADVATNIDQFDRYQDLVETKVSTLIRILNGTFDSIKETTLANGRVHNELYTTRYQYYFALREQTYRETLANGNNTLIQSPKVRKAIFDYYTLIEERQAAVTAHNSSWNNMLSSLIPGEEYASGIQSNRALELTPKGKSILLEALKNRQQELQPIINLEIHYARRASRNIEDLKGAASNLLQNLESELKSKTS